ncbi:BTAD domain-containing putative transcriptional regulator [Streptosporangium sp. NPDC000239]|uniref:AfsR/SARP family transcriptional regulator n=1 Tax=Streptosporangium sp. NPDC000239 TaxID=3154248 RepID=UPI00331F982B
MGRRVLSLLLAHAGQTVSVETLIEELWGERPPKLARKTVQTYIYSVRKALRKNMEGKPPIETGQHGYRIRPEEDRFDLWCFQKLCEAGFSELGGGDVEAASDSYRRALALWRGRPFEDVETGVLLMAQQARLEELRMHALEQRIEADMALGRHRELLTELSGLVISHPLNEVICGQLMRAAAHSGRQHVALDAYRRLRTTTANELGLEPSPQLRDLQRRILEGQVSLERPRVRVVGGPPQKPPAELPARTPGFTAHSREVADIVRAVRPAAAASSGPSTVRIVLVAGGVGVGKTVTAVEASHCLRRRYPDGQLFTTLHRPDSTPVPVRDALTSLLLSAGYLERHLPESTEDMARLFRSWTSERRMLVMLDDAHSCGQVLPLIPNSPGCAVIVTSRWRLEGLPGAVTHVPLEGMSDHEGVVLLSSVIGAQRVARERAAAMELVRLYEGSPLALVALGERLRARPHLFLHEVLRRARDHTERLALLQGPRNDCLRRLREAYLRLPAAERRLLSTLSRLPGPVREVDLWNEAGRPGPYAREFGRLVESLLASHSLKVRDRHDGPVLEVPGLLRLMLSTWADRPWSASVGDFAFDGEDRLSLVSAQAARSR